MTTETQAYSTGDWIVHRNHGVAQIEGTEVLHVGGQKSSYFRIQARASTFWMPPEKMTADWLRPLASRIEIKQAIGVLRRAPRRMNADHVKRKSRIDNVKPNNAPVVIAKLLRDLTARRNEKKQLSQSDLKALRHIADLFLAEWAVCMNLDMKVVRQQLNDLLAKA
jgi:RNA polymerase-interacting CarD/CdnL/TRCF family regulator